MTFLLGLMPWWGWILVVLAVIGLAMFPVQALAIARRVPWQAWAALLVIVILFGAYRVGYEVKERECIAANKAAKDAADKEAMAQEVEAPKVADNAEQAIKPKIEERIRYVEKYNTIACDVPYPDELQQTIREAATAANRL